MFSKIKTWLADHLHLLFKSAADNHLRIQRCADGSYQCNIRFDSYSDLKRYQKKVRTVTVSLSSAVAMVLIAAMVSPLIFRPNKSGAASYSWNQTSWDAAANVGATITHPTPGTSYSSKDANISISNPSPADSSVTLSSISASKKYSNNGDQGDTGVGNGGFNISGSDFSGGNVVLNPAATTGQGADANVELGISLNINSNFGDNSQGLANLNRGVGDVFLDKANNKIYTISISLIIRFDSGGGGTTRGANFQAFGSAGSGVNQFTNPKGIAVDTVNNKVYVTDSSLARIVRFDSGSGGTTFGANWQTFGTAGTGSGQFSLIHDAAVDSSANKVYATDFGNHRIVRFDSGSGGTTFGANWQTFGTAGTGSGQFAQPSAIFLDSANNKLYTLDGQVCLGYDYEEGYCYDDAINERIARFDSGGGGTTFGANWQTFGSLGSGAGQFLISENASNSGMALDMINNKAYVADWGNSRVAIFDSGSGGTTLGANWQTFGTNGAGSGKFSNMGGVAVDGSSNKVFVSTDTFSAKPVAIFDSGSGGTTLGANWHYIGANNVPSDVNSLAGLYSVYADNSNNRVYAFASDSLIMFDSGSGGTAMGANWQTFGSSGAGVGQFSFPRGIFLDSANNKIYATDTGNHRIVRFDSGGGGTTLGANWQALGGPTSGGGAGQFNNPQGITLDSANNKIYVTDNGNSRLVRLDSGGGGTTFGASWQTFGTYGGGTNNFYFPRGVFVDSASNKAYVADGSNNRIVRIDSGGGGTTLGANWQTFGSSGTGTNQFQSLKGMSADIAANKIYAIDTFNNRISRFDSGGGGTTFGANWQSINGPTGTFEDISVDPVHRRLFIAISGTSIASAAALDTGGSVLSYYTSGTYTSNIVDTGQKNSAWGNVTVNDSQIAGAQTLKIKLRSCDDAACSAAGVVDESATKSFNSCSLIPITQASQTFSATSALPTNCVTSGDQFIQYQAVFAGDASSTAKLNDISIAYSYYPTSFQKLISSPFNSTDKFTSLGNLAWTASNDTTQGIVNFQMRTAPSNTLGTAPDWANGSGWCGKSDCSSDKSDTAFATSYYDTKAGSTPQASQSDHAGNQWIQYAAFLKSADGSQAPVLSDVTASFAYNNPPAMTLSSASQLNSGVDKGKIKTDYVMQETATEQTSAYSLLFYQPDSITLKNATTAAGAENIVLTTPANVPVPSSGMVLLDKELIAYTGKTVDSTTQVTLTGISRGQQFVGGGNYLTEAVVHTAGAGAFFKATGPTGQIASSLTTDTSTKTTTWDPKSDTNLLDKKWTNFKMVVAGNDNDAYGNRVGVAISNAFTVDLEKPVIKNITSPAANGRYNAGKNVDVTINFADGQGNAKNVTSTGAVTIALETGNNDYNCVIPQISTPASSATCTYQVQAGDMTDDLAANSPINANITDQFGNALFSTNIPAGQNISDSKDIVIDTTAPIVSDVSPTASAFINSVTSVKGGSDVSFTVNESLKNGSYLRFTSTSGSDNGTQYTCTLQGTSLNVAAHNAFELKQGANNCAEAQSALQNGSVYTLTVHAVDQADNVTDQSVTGITFDTVDPNASITSLSDGDFINNITDDSDISYDAGEPLQSGTYLKFSRTSGSADASSPRTCNLSGSELTQGSHNHVDLNAVCGGFSLVDGAVYSVDLHAVDRAGNTSDASTKNNITFDQTAPVLTSFTSDKANANPANAYGIGEVIDIKAVFAENLANGSTMTVQLENNANPPVNVVLNQISGNTLSGTFTVQGPRKGYDTPDLTLRSVVSENVTDRAGNVRTDSAIPSGQNLGDTKDIAIDTGTPILLSFTAKKLPENSTSGSFKAPTQIKITAMYSKPIASGSVTVHLNTDNGSEKNTDVTLSTVSGSTISGTYTVAAGDNADDLKVAAITAQSATDFKGNPLTTTGAMADYDVFFHDLDNTIDPVVNISGFQIDTTAPVLGATPISFAVAKTNSQTPQINLSATDNFDLSDGSVRFSLNNGSSWCGALPYASSTTGFDITSSACGGSSTNEVKTVTVKFIDKAGNESGTGNAQIEYDNSKPVLQKITAEQGSGVYGPGNQIKVIAQYNETLASGSALTVKFDNDKQLTLNTIENNNQLTATYTVGATGSGEDTDKLKVVNPIVSQNVSDTAIPTNTQDSTSLAGITENIDTNKAIVVDTTAPTGSVVVDNSALTAAVSASDANADNLEYEAYVAANYTDNCSFSGNWQPYGDGQTVSFSSNSSISRKACLKLRDQAGNESAEITAITPETPQGLEFTNISNKSITPAFLGSFFTWNIPAVIGKVGDQLEKSELLWCNGNIDGGDCTPDQTANITNTVQNYYVFNNLTPDKNYCYQLRFKNTHGDYGAFTDKQCAIAGEGPVPANTEVSFASDPLVENVTDSGATVTFKTVDADNADTPLVTTATVEVYADENLSSLVKTVEDDISVTHTMKITGLETSKQYYLKIKAKGSGGNEKTVAFSISAPDKYSFTTLGTLSKITIGANQPSIVTDRKAVVDFTTDQNAKCYIEFKESAIAAYNPIDNSGLESEAKKNHSITVTSLLSERKYDYKITCADALNDSVIITKGATEDDLLPSFTTLKEGILGGGDTGDGSDNPPQISGVSLSAITGENATITWNTDKKASSSVAYEADGTDFMLMSGDYNANSDTANYTTAHEVAISGLVPATKYTFSVMSTDTSGNISQSSQSSFTTKQPSGLSSVKVVSKALGQATVSWTTGQATSSLVEYGLTTSYGDKKESSSKVKDHELTITDLTPGSEYHLRVKGTGENGELFASSDITFQPKSPPKISDFKVDSIFEHGATVSFTTNVPTDALVTYTNTDDAQETGLQGNPTVSSKHEIELKDISSGDTFALKVKVRDEEGNETEETFPSFTTTKDENPPVFDKIKTDTALTQNDKVQTIISWTTNELATGTVVYKEGRNGDEKSFEVNTTPSFSHVAVITSFKPGTVYYFNVRSKDVADNTGKSNDYAVLTPKKSQNIIQIIVGNFQDIFKWAKF